MGIPPPNRYTGANSPSDRSSESDRGKPNKNFRLPEKKGKGEEGKGEKKGLFDLIQDEKEEKMALEAQSSLLQNQQFAQELEAQKTQSITEVQAQEAVAQITQLIQKMISNLQVGRVGGSEFASIDLKGQGNVPSFFANTNLTLTHTSQGLVIRFSNFETPQQQAAAIKAVEMQKEQLSQMMLNLQQKNIQVAELIIGDQSVSLPRIQPLPPPFQTTSSPETQAGTSGERQEEEGEGKSPEEKPRR